MMEILPVVVENLVSIQLGCSSGDVRAEQTQMNKCLLFLKQARADTQTAATLEFLQMRQKIVGVDEIMSC